MNEIQAIMKLELLPNEILFECFQYLNAVHIFQSFDQLNYRFNKLIRSIPLHLDFQNIHKLLFDQLCRKLSSSPEIKAQVYSLHLSNDRSVCNKIHVFLSFLSLDQFPHLRSLTLTKVKKDDIPQLTMVLPLMSHLSCFRLISSWNTKNEIFSVLPISQLRTLNMKHIISDLDLTYDLSSIIYLTIYRCDYDRLCRVLNNATRLNYLKIEHFGEYTDWDTYTNLYAINRDYTNLNKLILMDFHGKFCDLAEILKRTSNLKSLTINVPFDKDMIDACKWEDLITSSLPFLKVFKFHFKYLRENENDDISHEKLKQFQNDFWHKKHHWYTEYSLSNREASIYTIPYILDTCVLTSDTSRYFEESLNNVSTFDQVRNLTLIPDLIAEKCQYHFPYVTSLTLGDPLPFTAMMSQDIKHIDYLKMIVNFWNIKHLVIGKSLWLDTPFVLLKILKESPQLSSLVIHPDVLISLFDNEELCRYLNKMIKKLDISYYFDTFFNSSHKMYQLCKSFSNVEQLVCKINDHDSLLFLIKHLPKLSCIDVHFGRFTNLFEISHLEEETQKLDINIMTNIYGDFDKKLSIWIIRNMY